MTTTCPHCGATCGHYAAAEAHIRACTADPAVRAAVLAVLSDPAHPGHVVTERHYQRVWRNTPRAISGRTLRHRFGSWSTVAAEFGLLPSLMQQERGSMDRGPAVDAYDADRAEYIAAESAARAAEAASRTGLPVCGCRALPDGRIAWMVR